ncbi:hypothetical protein BDV23DRAFT_193965 [Aspergillus alliaceus]|uniref:Uncharacterized protein n=1 Tax=Petromyces alliaceus TaxID=209559 RepID=A0A5N7C7E8_PETAA|nr:hypothetical protein BDV23DRAFT_193965 [Aspergillus alliaceus]
MPGTATHPVEMPSPTSPQSPHGSILERGSEDFVPTQDPRSPGYTAHKNPSFRPREDSSILSLLKPSHDETRKDADTGFAIPGRSKDPQEHHDMPGILDAAHIAKLLSTNSRILSLQEKVSLKRSEVQELRTALRFKREEEAEIRAQFIRHLTVAQEAQTTDQILLENNEALLSATGEYSDMEAEYNRKESQLERDEYTLIKAMEDFARLSPNHSLPTPEETPLEDQDRSSDVSSTTSSGPEDPPDVVEYVSRVADVRIIQEGLIHLDEEWLFIRGKQAERESLGISMDDESLQFLQTYEEERREICDELFNAQRDIDQLRAVCLTNGHLTDEYIRGRDLVYEINPATLANHPVDLLKVSPEEDASPFHPVEEPVSQNQFVNKWLLHRLRQSSVEISHLKSLPEIKSLFDQGFDDKKVSQMSLEEWFEDDASKSPPPPPATSDMSVQEAGSARTHSV